MDRSPLEFRGKSAFYLGDLFFAYKNPLKYRILYFGFEHNQSLRKSSWISLFRIISVGL